MFDLLILNKAFINIVHHKNYIIDIKRYSNKEFSQ